MSVFFDQLQFGTQVFYLALTALAGGVGAALRFVLDGAVTAWVARSKKLASFPLGILLVNLSGSFLIGVLAGFVSAGSERGSLELLIGVGLLGGYTTFSTTSVDTLRLALTGRGVAALLNGLGQLLAGVALAALGFWFGGLR